MNNKEYIGFLAGLAGLGRGGRKPKGGLRRAREAAISAWGSALLQVSKYEI
ncbi:hypothetical protein [Chromobacterium alkanivorans]|uniref:hypothetical protein n=1 Tax=Chromobacterium alkanivorans TaxID=1071719 RepID=UPI002169409B|nr:hypothetical protein [Chromobacterium alkanivorans]MCS3806869.1 hypothetical protein [Chromobacterium alkanivorans]